MKILLELIGKYVSITGNTFIDGILFAFIGLVSFSIAFGLVGIIFDAIGTYNSKIMSDVHWSVRVTVFVTLTYIFLKLFQFFAWILSFEWWVYFIVGSAIILIIAMILTVKYIIKSKKRDKIFRTIKECLTLLRSYSVEIICLVFISVLILINLYYYKCISDFTDKSIYFKEGSINLIIVVLPFVLTVLSIALSLPKDLIYGIEKTEFRKLKGASKYSFLGMLVIAMIIFTLYLIVAIFELPLGMFGLALVSIIYSFCFLLQEIPLLMHSDKRIESIIKHNVWHNENNENLNSVIYNLLFTKGLLYTYKLLENKKNKGDNEVYFNKLLDLQNFYLWRYRENYSDKFNEAAFEFKNLKIIDVIDKSFENITVLLEFNEDMNLNSIYKGKDFTYQVTRLIFSLRDVLDILVLDKKYEDKFRGFILAVFGNIRYANKDFNDKVTFSYKLLNMMMIHTLSIDQIWFIKILREHAYLSTNVMGGTIEYMVFISIYLYYLSEMESSVPDKFKNEINEFINEVTNYSNLYGNSWVSVLNRKLDFLGLKNASELLVKLLKIFDTNSDSMFWYIPDKKGVYSTTLSKSFTSDLIIHWWIGFVLTNEEMWIHSMNNHEVIEIPDLSDEYLDKMARILNDRWFEDNKIRQDIDLSIFEFFGEKNKIDNYFDNRELVIKFKKFAKERIFLKMTNEYESHAKSKEDYNKYKKMLSNGLNKAFHDYIFLDTNVNLADVKPVYYTFSIETLYTEKLIDMYVEGLPESLSRLLYENFKENKKNINQIKSISKYYDEELNRILNFAPDYRITRLFDLDADEQRRKSFERINQIPYLNKVWLPRDVFLKKGAIKANFEYLDEPSFVRGLTEDEVNIIIDRDFRLVNGLYKYLEYSNSKSGLMLDRGEIFELISKKYMFACIVFKYKIEYDYNKILFYEFKK